MSAVRARWVAGVTALLGLVAALAQAPAQAQSAPTLEIAGLSVEGSELVASLAVLDAGGNPVSGIATSSFTARVDNAAATVTSTSTSSDAALPLGIVLTVDTSGSMAGAAIAAARSALSSTVASLRPNDQATLITFAQAVTRVVEPTAPRSALETAISGMQAGGNTALFAGVSAAANTVTALPQPRRAVLLLSDGEDFGDASGGITRDQALAAAVAGKAPFFVVGLGAEVDQAFLSSLAQSTGGQYFAAATPTELGQLYSRISDRLRQQYTLRVALPANLSAGEHQLTINLGAASARSAFQVTGPASTARVQFNALPSRVAEAVVVPLSGAPAGVSPRFAIDGAVVRAETGGKAVRIDPYELSAGTHTLTVTFPPATEAAATATFTVDALAPRILEPATLPDLRPGDLVRLTIQAQPPGAAVRFLVDDAERGRLEAAPYEFVLPDEDYAEGAHQLRVVVQSPGGETSANFPFEIATQTTKSSNTAAVVLGLVGVLAGIIVLLLLVRRLLKRRAEQREADQAAREVARLSASGGPAEAGSGATAPAVPPWGILRIVEGPDAGKVFELRAETELVGRGRYCTVRLTDTSLAEEHFILTSDGRIASSSPANAIQIGGNMARTRQLEANESFSAGNTGFEFVRMSGQDP